METIKTIKTKQIEIVIMPMSFLPESCQIEKLHVELYFHEAKMEYSTIWSQSPNARKSAEGYIKHGWIIDYDLGQDQFPLNELTFECRINILKVMRLRKELGMLQSDHDNAYYYDARPLCNINKMRFIWHMNDRLMIDNLTKTIYDNHNTGVIQWHSDVYHDMASFFQLNMDFHVCRCLQS